MANREENLKKINAELEKLSDKELEEIAGGIMILDKRYEKEPNANIENPTRIIHWTA